MAVRRRAKAEQSAHRINTADELLRSGMDLAQAARRLARRYKVSERQARRYLEAARQSGPVPVPGPKVVFTVKVEAHLARRIRSYARMADKSISQVVAQALEEFLQRSRSGPGGGR